MSTWRIFSNEIKCKSTGFSLIPTGTVRFSNVLCSEIWQSCLKLQGGYGERLQEPLGNEPHPRFKDMRSVFRIHLVCWKPVVNASFYSLSLQYSTSNILLLL